jgi:hypothetical protein
LASGNTFPVSVIQKWMNPTDGEMWDWRPGRVAKLCSNLGLVLTSSFSASSGPSPLGPGETEKSGTSCLDYHPIRSVRIYGKAIRL